MQKTAHFILQTEGGPDARWWAYLILNGEMNGPLQPFSYPTKAAASEAVERAANVYRGSGYAVSVATSGLPLLVR